ncbi:MAG: hypothetical protein V4726_17535 [Verrucomicrobiota bacterium]
MSETAPPDPVPPASPADGGGALIFDWSPVRWHRTRLLFFVGLAVGGHLLLFYLFKVAAPPAPRTVPPVRSVMLLSPQFPASAALMERMEDKYPALTPPMPLAEPDAGALHKLVKGYEATWERDTARLKPLPAAAQGGGLPSIMPDSALLLPPLPAGDPAPVAASSPLSSADPAPLLPRALPVLSVQSGLGGRTVLQPPVWPADVLQPDWPEESPVSFMISVSAEGKVLSCLPLSSVSFDIEVLRRPLLALRFSPRTDSDDTAWGWIDVQW